MSFTDEEADRYFDDRQSSDRPQLRLQQQMQNRSTPKPTTRPSLQGTRSPSERSITFGSVDITSFPVAIGEGHGPPRSGGPPISLAKNPVSTASFDLEHYETNREKRRQVEEMITPPNLREDLLREAGYSTLQIYESMRKASHIQQQRKASKKGNVILQTLREQLQQVFSNSKRKGRNSPPRAVLAKSA